MQAIEILNIETNEKKTFPSSKVAAEYIGTTSKKISDALKNKSLLKNKYRCKRIPNPIEIIEEWKPRIEGYDYSALRRQILSILSRNKCEGIVFIDQSTRHKQNYYQIHLKKPSEELLKEIKDMLV